MIEATTEQVFVYERDRERPSEEKEPRLGTVVRLIGTDSDMREVTRPVVLVDSAQFADADPLPVMMFDVRPDRLDLVPRWLGGYCVTRASQPVETIVMDWQNRAAFIERLRSAPAAATAVEVEALARIAEEERQRAKRLRERDSETCRQLRRELSAVRTELTTARSQVTPPRRESWWARAVAAIPQLARRRARGDDASDE